MIGNYLDLHAPRTRSIEFTQIYALPPAQNDIPPLDDNHQIISHERGFQVACTVTFKVSVIRLIVRNDPVQICEHISNYIWVGIFVQAYPRSGVWYENDGNPIVNLTFMNNCFNLGSNFNKGAMRGCFD